MATLAIKGHATRGSEVIGLLGMLGGKNGIEYIGYSDDFVYFINNGEIDVSDAVFDNAFTLEQFLEKFPYKVGDKVNVCGENAASVIGMRWESDYVVYRVRLEKNGYETSKMVEELQPYTGQKLSMYKLNVEKQKGESMEEPKELLIGFTKDDNGDWVLNTHKDYEIKEFDGKFKLVKKQPQYPKTYKECCVVLGKISTYALCGLHEDEYPLFDRLIELKRCRDAYWKIAGNWKPDWHDNKTDKYIITNFKNEIVKDLAFKAEKNSILAFPTEEMRDAFFGNFKELIESCKELL